MKKQTKEKGSALILSMILVLVLSVMATSMMFLSQSETIGSMNYRLMTQARYGAEAGLHSAANYLMNTYQSPGDTTDPLSAYGTYSQAQPVNYNGTPVVLSSITSGDADDAPNYPVSSVQSGFASNAQGTLAAGATTVNYSASATLLTMQQITVFGSTTPQTVQKWLITGRGTIADVRNATVEVSAVMEQMVSPMFNYAAFAQSNFCQSLDFGGGGGTNSYDSRTAGTPTFVNTGGNVGTNGAMIIQGNVTIGGNLSAPRSGSTTQSNQCPAGTVASSIALIDVGGATLTGSITELPQPVTYPTLTVPAPGTVNLDLKKTSGNGNNVDCSTIISTCTGGSNSGNFTLSPGNYGDIIGDGNVTVSLTAGTYNINAICSSSSPTFNIVSGPVILNVTGNSANLSSSTCANPIDFSAQTTITNSTGSWDPGTLQMIYEGTGNVNLAGGAQALGLVYAPNATVKFVGGSQWYGSVIANNITDMGGVAIHYDRKLQSEYFTRGNYMLHSFSWSRN